LGFDLQADLGSDRLTARRLLYVILPRLPADSWFKRTYDPEKREMSPEWYVLADICDGISIGNWQRQNTGVENESQVSPRPKPYPRPGAVATEMQQEQQQRRRRDEIMRRRQARAEVLGGG